MRKVEHIQIPEKADLIHKGDPATHCLQKHCTHMYNDVYIHLEKVETASQNACTVTVPIEQYADFEVHSFFKR